MKAVLFSKLIWGVLIGSILGYRGWWVACEIPRDAQWIDILKIQITCGLIGGTLGMLVGIYLDYRSTRQKARD